MGFPAYTPSPVRLVTLSEADGDENLSSATTNVSLEQLADGIKYLDDTLVAATTSRSITRVQTSMFTASDASVWHIDQYGDADQLTNDIVESTTCPLPLPHGVVLTAVSVRVMGATGHAGLPGTMPTIHVIRHVMPAHTSLGTASDTSASVGAYEDVHSITVSGLNVTIDRTLYRYSVRLHGETGANFVLGLKAFAAICTYTITSYDSD